jgi:hypothetical protein
LVRSFVGVLFSAVLVASSALADDLIFKADKAFVLMNSGQDVLPVTFPMDPIDLVRAQQVFRDYYSVYKENPDRLLQAVRFLAGLSAKQKEIEPLLLDTKPLFALPGDLSDRVIDAIAEGEIRTEAGLETLTQIVLGSTAFKTRRRAAEQIRDLRNLDWKLHRKRTFTKGFTPASMLPDNAGGGLFDKFALTGVAFGAISGEAAEDFIVRKRDIPIGQVEKSMAVALRYGGERYPGDFVFSGFEVLTDIYIESRLNEWPSMENVETFLYGYNFEKVRNRETSEADATRLLRLLGFSRNPRVIGTLAVGVRSPIFGIRLGAVQGLLVSERYQELVRTDHPNAEMLNELQELYNYALRSAGVIDAEAGRRPDVPTGMRRNWEIFSQIDLPPCLST